MSQKSSTLVAQQLIKNERETRIQNNTLSYQSSYFKNDNGINRVKNNHIRAYGLQIILLVIYEKTSYMIKVSMEVTTHKISFTKKKKQF